MSESEQNNDPPGTCDIPGSALITALDLWNDEVTRPHGYLILRGASAPQLSPLLRPWLDALVEDGDMLIEISVGSDEHGSSTEDRAEALREQLAVAIEARFPDYCDPRAGFHARLADLLGRLSADYLAPPSRRLLLVIHGLDKLRPACPNDNPLPRLLPHILPRGVFLLATIEHHSSGQRWLNALADVEMIDVVPEPRETRAQTMHTPSPRLALDLGSLCAAIDRDGLGHLIAELGEAVAREKHEKHEKHEDRRRIVVDLKAALIALTPQLAGDPKTMPALLWGELLDRNWSKRQLREFFAAQAPALRRLLPRQHRERAAAILVGHSATVNCLALSPDGRLIASASSDGTLKLWLVDSGAEQFTLSGHLGPVNACAFTANGHLLSASDDGNLHLWHTDSGTLLRTFSGHGGGIEGLVLGHDGKHAASLGADGQLLVWEFDSATEIRRVLAHELGGTALALSPDGTTLATASHDKSIKLWNFSTLAPKQTLIGPGYAISGLAFDPKGARIAASSYDNQLWIWALPSGDLLHEIIGHGSWVTSCEFVDDDLLLSSSRDRSVRLWSLADGEERCLLHGHTKMVNTAISDPSGTWIFSAGSDHTLRRWRIPTGKSKGKGEGEGHDGPIRACLFGPHGHLYSAGSDGTLRRWDLSSGTARGVYHGHQHAVLGIAISSDGTTLLSAGSDRCVKIWDNQRQLIKGELRGHQKWVSACALSPSGEQLATASHDTTLRIWEMPSGALQRTLEGHREHVRCCVFEATGRLISGGDDGMIRVWDPNLGRELMTLAGHEGAVRSLAISPSGQHLLSAGADGTIRLWSLRRGRERLILRGHEAEVVGVAFIDEDHLLSASADRSLRLWSLSAERCLSSLRSSHPFGALSVSSTAADDGRSLALAGDDAGDLWLLVVDLSAL